MQTNTQMCHYISTGDINLLFTQALRQSLFREVKTRALFDILLNANIKIHVHVYSHKQLNESESVQAKLHCANDLC